MKQVTTEKGGGGRGEPAREGKNFRHKAAFFIVLSKDGVRTFSLGSLQGRIKFGSIQREKVSFRVVNGRK